MRFGSLFSGIEAASVAWLPLGWQCAWVAEVDPFCRALLAHHYPQVPNLGDVTKADWSDHAGSVELVAGGSPCQSFSVAGQRLGLADPRGNLALHFLRVVGRLRPRWFVFENVPGLLSSARGRDLGAFLGIVGQLGYGWAYRVLDAQHFGVPQRRRRIFVVGYLGDWRPAVAVLFEPQGLRRNPAPGRKPRAQVARCLVSGVGGPGRFDPTSEQLITHALTGEGFDASEDGSGRGTPLVATAFHASQDPITRQDGKSHALGRGAASVAVAIPILEAGKRCGIKGDARDGLGIGQPGGPMFTLQAGAQHGLAISIRGREGGGTAELGGQIMPAMRASQGGGDKPHVLDAMAVRRLTPRECERLQGFPDDYTLIPWRRGLAPDGLRYKALGNSWAVPVARWLGGRIAIMDAHLRRLGQVAA